MTRDSVLQLRYVGVFPKAGHREYKFQIEKRDAGSRDVSLTIDDGLFGANKLLFQEAHDLCYQKLLADLCSESHDIPIPSRAAVSATDINRYRECHPTGGARKAGIRNHP